jgi:hypothetical protein
MKKTIFNVYVAMTSQEQCDRMKAVCLENGLPIWVNDVDPDLAFALFDLSKNFKWNGIEFLVGFYIENQTQVTEAEFLELLKEYKNGTQVHD